MYICSCCAKFAHPSCLILLQALLHSLPSLKDLCLYRNTEVTSALLTKATVLSMVNLTALDLRETGITGTCVGCVLCAACMTECVGPTRHVSCAHGALLSSRLCRKHPSRHTHTHGYTHMRLKPLLVPLPFALLHVRVCV